MREVARHGVGEQRITHALEDIRGRTFGRWDRPHDDRLSLERLR